MNLGELHVWRVPLDCASVPPPTPGERARAARFRSPEAGERYLRSHAALRVILATVTRVKLDFALTPLGKPFLPSAPQVRFNLSRSHDVALIGVAFDVDVGVDVERIRPVPEHIAIAERFLPPAEAAAHAAVPEPEVEFDFFRRWTRAEAMLKARGVGLLGAGTPLDGAWTVEEIPVPPEYAAAAAATAPALALHLHDY